MFIIVLFQVQILSATVAYIDQLHHKLLDQIHSVGIPPQLIKGDFAVFFSQGPQMSKNIRYLLKNR